jgi:hypothetical protein
MGLLYFPVEHQQITSLLAEVEAVSHVIGQYDAKPYGVEQRCQPLMMVPRNGQGTEGLSVLGEGQYSKPRRDPLVLLHHDEIGDLVSGQTHVDESTGVRGSPNVNPNRKRFCVIIKRDAHFSSAEKGMTMPVFVSGLNLSRRFFREVVRPLLANAFPAVRYAAALLGPGSEVLGFDTEMSVDHDWGPRVFVFFA